MTNFSSATAGSAYGESALFKVENNGVVYGKHDRLFEKYQSFSEEQLKKNLAHLKAFLERHPSSTFAIVPSSYTVYPQDLPAGLQQVDQSAEIETIRQELSDTAENLDLLTLLQKQQSESLYYRTDHHWTTDGAYLAYRAFCEQKGLSPVELSTLTRHDVEGFYGTVLQSAFFALANVLPSEDAINYMKEKATMKFSKKGQDIVDMNQERAQGNGSEFSNLLTQQLQQNLAAGEQSLLLLNRRGYHTIIACCDCNTPVECPNCSVPLTYHRANDSLMCHYCGYCAPPVQECPNCKSTHLKQMGFGTQKLEEALGEIVPYIVMCCKNGNNTTLPVMHRMWI